jgi:DNA-binding transcriptional LysR family regulator
VELRHLQHFIAVAEERHFTRAAQRLNIAQSALSSSVRFLEEELGSRLFVRSTRSVQLTRSGEVLLDRARQALEVIQGARQAVSEVEGLKTGTIAIGTAHSMPNFIALPELIARFHDDHPGIEVHLRQGDRESLVEQLRLGRLDIAFLPLLDPLDDMQTRFMACEDLVAALPPGHPLAGRASVTLADLCAAPFVDFSAGWATRPLCDRAFARAGLSRRTVSEVTDLETLVSLVARGLGVALLPASIAAARAPDIAIAELVGTDVCWELVAAFAGGGGPDRSLPINAAARAFLSLI